MKNPHPIYLFRHGRTEWNAIERIQGALDSPLTEQGRAQAQALGATLRQELRCAGIDLIDVAVVASPLGRVRQTVEIACAAAGLDVVCCRFDERLREVSWGAWDGLTRAEIERLSPGALAERNDLKWQHQPPGGESYAMAAPRAQAALADLVRLAAARPVTAFSHGAVGRLLRGAYGGLSPEQIVELDEPQDAFFRLQAGAITRIPAS
ncbi:MAG: histidine phosphatase family protein [Alphaproteobacteria bacterium]|nr:histidine phosphatase family protein [Alphaproteobacteria bacterium]